MAHTPTVETVLAALASLEDAKMRAVNEPHGDDHGVNLTKLRALAKEVKGTPGLRDGLWNANDTAGQLVSILIAKPSEFTEDEYDDLLRAARSPKVQDWLVNYLVKKSEHAEPLRVRWMTDADPVVASAGWELTAWQASKGAEHVESEKLLDVIERDMVAAPERLQWAMNHTLAEIGINFETLRARALDIGERLGVLRDYPTPPNCTSPFAPIWITEMVRRRVD